MCHTEYRFLQVLKPDAASTPVSMPSTEELLLDALNPAWHDRFLKEKFYIGK